MKRILLWLLPLALVVACGENVKEPEPKPEPPVPEKEKDALVITTGELTASPEGQEWQLALQANVTVQATTDVEWITVTPPTKAMVEKQFIVRVSANDSGATRVGNITFTAGEVSQQVKVSQEALPPPPPPAEYVLLLHADDLAVGDELLLVNQSGNSAMGSQKDNYRTSVTVTVEDDAVVDPDEKVAVVTLSGKEDAWNLQVTGGFLAAPTEAKNQLLTVNEVTGYATWKIDIVDGRAIIKAQNGERNLICYNNRDSRFVCADATSSNLSEVVIYQKLKEVELVTRFDAIGFYLGGTREWVYSAGTDQILRSYSGSELTFALLDMVGRAQIKASGYSTSMQVGDAVTLTVEWRVGWNIVISREYNMTVLKDEGGKVWIGDTRGRGVILKK